jgi:hypothetical protein
MTIVMGLDQHRAQITADWLDTDSGEIGRARVSPAHRDEVRAFLTRFAGRRLEVALEATTGWRFVVEELRAIGAEVHLAEPAETAARRGPKKRAKTDRADARHLRELLMIDRLPESWIPPDHLLATRVACAARKDRRWVAISHRPALEIRPVRLHGLRALARPRLRSAPAQHAARGHVQLPRRLSNSVLRAHRHGQPDPQRPVHLRGDNRAAFPSTASQVGDVRDKPWVLVRQQPNRNGRRAPSPATAPPIRCCCS